jgi:molybdate/tungstate transport system permease protein
MGLLRGKSTFILISAVLGTVMILFLTIPVTVSLLNSVNGIPQAFIDIRTRAAITTSFICALLATLFSLFFGVPFAYLFTRYEFPGKNVINSVLDLPLLIPHNAAGIALLVVLSPKSVIGGMFSILGVSFLDSIYGIVAAMAFVSAPFMIRSVQDAFTSIDPDIERVARSLGANRFQVFSLITLPLAYRGILTGCIMTWARSLSEFGAVVILAYYPKTVPVHLYDVFLAEGLNAALPINGIMIIFSLLFLVAYRYLMRDSYRTVI